MTEQSDYKPFLLVGGSYDGRIVQVHRRKIRLGVPVRTPDEVYRLTAYFDDGTHWCTYASGLRDEYYNRVVSLDNHRAIHTLDQIKAWAGRIETVREREEAPATDTSTGAT